MIAINTLITPDLAHILQYAAYGGVSAFVAACCRDSKLQLPRLIHTVDKEDGGKIVYFDLGFLAAPFLGAVLAMLTRSSPESAIAYGLAAGYAGPRLLDAITGTVLGALQPRTGDTNPPHELPEEKSAGDPR